MDNCTPVKTKLNSRRLEKTELGKMKWVKMFRQKKEFNTAVSMPATHLTFPRNFLEWFLGRAQPYMGM